MTHIKPGPVEQALRDEWEKDGHGELGMGYYNVYDFLHGLDRLDEVKDRGDTCCVMADVIAALLDELQGIREQHNKLFDELSLRRKEVNTLKHDVENAVHLAQKMDKKAAARLQHAREVEDVIGCRNATIADLKREVKDLKAELTSVSDRLMPEGMSWPRFEDGEPVKVGDEIRVDTTFTSIGTVESITFSESGAEIESDYHQEAWNPNEPVKRPSVLDVDGVEIKVGDTVYRVDDGGGHEVTGFLGGEYLILDGGLFALPRDYTHAKPEPPDSWERLEQDAGKGVCEYVGAEPAGAIDAHDCETCRLYKNSGYKTCETMMARDLIARAKKLAGVE